jgi:cytochrome P450
VEARRVTMLVAARTLFGLDLTGDEDRLMEAFSYLTQKATSPLTAWDNLPIRLPVTPYRKYLRAVRTVEETAQAAMLRARQVDPSDSLLAQLVHNPDSTDPPLTEAEIRAQVLQLFDAGHSTTSSALAWCLYLLDRNPDVMAKLSRELATVAPDGRPSYSDLDRLLYLDQVIREALRLYPPIWGQARFSHKDFDIAGYRIPAGSYVLVSQWVTQRLPELFADPDRFDPERFAAGATPVPYSYFPFGGGYHACIGNIYAIQEAKVVLTMILSRFHPRLVPGHPVEPVIRSMTLQPALGLPMTLEPAGIPVAARG